MPENNTVNFPHAVRVTSRPMQPCMVCGGIRFWLRDTGWGKPEWLCCQCHPYERRKEATDAKV